MTQVQARRSTMRPEDMQRVDRLSEEVRGRLYEIALIVSRTVGVQAPTGHVEKFVPREAVPLTGRHADADAGGGDWVEIGEVDGTEYCYGEIGGQAFAESPCGAAQ
ncbi:hypothetical protein GCM10009665_28700 [Kitasatospora nipponensis]|uniref:Uncharacterized protein n=1 Tax=Kitasatospora nipponensis TaxID=258049 RepID=A0ABN1W8P3_9ACTN